VRTLGLTTDAMNQDKGEADPSNWLPPEPTAVCEYVADWIAIKGRWGLSMDKSEYDRIRNLLEGDCAGTIVAPWPSPPPPPPPTTQPPPPPPSFDLQRPVSCAMAAPVSVGAVGPDVGCLERRLADVAANVVPFVVDDAFGPDTEQAVRQFQEANGLVVDGAVGPQTATVLGIWSPPPPPPPPPPQVQPVVPQQQAGDCTPGYDPCLPPASDYDCAGGSGNGPEYTGRVRVTGSDPYDLDRDGDGVGCD